MKKRLQGFIFGLFVSSIILLNISLFADSIDVVLNSINISINGEKVVANSENYTLDNGENVPNSLLYKGTTYLPIRKISDLLGVGISWDGETRTVLIDTPEPTATPEPTPEPTATPEPDSIIKTPPEKPTGLSAKEITTTSFIADWNDVEGTYLYMVWHLENNDWVYMGLTIESEYQFTGLPEGTTHFYKISAVNRYGESGLSDYCEIKLENKTITSSQVISNLSELQTFLDNNYSELKTCIGNTKFTFEISENDRSYIEYDYWIKVRYEYDYFGGAMTSIKYTEEEKQQLRQELKNHQEKLAKAVIDAMPDKKFDGGYYDSWWEYPYSKVGLITRRYYSWLNYDKPDIFSIDFNQIYNLTKPSFFRWWSLIDDEL
jgi:hypothetical protein